VSRCLTPAGVFDPGAFQERYSSDMARSFRLKRRGVRALGWRPAWVFGPSWRTSVLYLAGMGDERVSVEEVAEAGDILAEEVDVLLERLTDKVLASPRAGSRAWYTMEFP